MTSITSLLVANRGEIACRIVRTARSMGLRTIAVYSDADQRARHVAEADEAVPLRGVSAAETYLDAHLILEAAALTGADAVHPGYGFLAENADFAAACAQAGLVFVGPTPDVIAAMGDKLRAKRIMADAGVPLPASVALEADTTLHDAAGAVGFPLLVKAVAGGGGKGMRLVAGPDELAESVSAARREAGAAFGDDRVFLERFLPSPRHVEVQIVGDTHGNIVNLGERECSVQRRHQKVIEESPSPAVDAELRNRLTAAAEAGARALGYTNAGTFEFVVDRDGDVAFLEVNTRLQVEHPVTEEVWRLRDGRRLDLVRLQLLVADGAPLPFTQADVVADGWAIEARVYAEDPAAGYLPATGTLHRWSFGDRPGVRIDAGVGTGDVVAPAYDPLLAKVVAAAPTRVEAAGRLAAALDEARIAGVTTNRDLLVEALRHPVFLDGSYDTGFLDDHLDGGRIGRPRQQHTDELHAIAAALCAARGRHRSAGVLRSVPMGWRNSRSQPATTVYRRPCGDELTVGYTLRRDGRFRVSVARVVWNVRVVAWPDEHPDRLLDLEIDGRRVRADVLVADGVAYVDSSAGHSRLEEMPRFARSTGGEVAGGLSAPTPGTVVSVAVSEGDAVITGQLLVVLEAMKMEHRVTAPADGVVGEVRVEQGAGVDTGDVLVVLHAHS